MWKTNAKLAETLLPSVDRQTIFHFSNGKLEEKYPSDALSRIEGERTETTKKALLEKIKDVLVNVA
jgi:hypothetical protein